MPRIVGKIRRRHPVEVEDVKFLRAHTTKPIKMTVPGPFTMSQQAQNDFYPTEAEAAMDYAAAVNEEIRDLFAAGADIVQIDEPYMQARPEKARQYGLQALNRALEGITGTTAVHICFGYAAVIHERPVRLFVPPRARRLHVPAGLDRDRAVEPRLLGADEACRARKSCSACIDLNDMTVETPETVAARIRRALPYVQAETSSSRPTAG